MTLILFIDFNSVKNSNKNKWQVVDQKNLQEVLFVKHKINLFICILSIFYTSPEYRISEHLSISDR